jgi:hypothetical protein
VRVVAPHNNKELWLIWQDPNTRLRYVIGKLWYKKQKYHFAYQSDGLESAKKSGFSYHPAFPFTDDVYKSDILFHAFAMRLPNKERQDYNEILNKYGLDSSCSDMDILAITGGKLATDNYEFVSALYSCNNVKLRHEFYIAGWRYWEGPKLSQTEFSCGTLLKIVAEKDNKYDKFALQVYTVNDIKIGYIPVFYSKIIYDYIAKGCNCYLTILKFDPSQGSSNVLKVQLVCDENCCK